MDFSDDEDFFARALVQMRMRECSLKSMRAVSLLMRIWMRLAMRRWATVRSLARPAADNFTSSSAQPSTFAIDPNHDLACIHIDELSAAQRPNSTDSAPVE